MLTSVRVRAHERTRSTDELKIRSLLEHPALSGLLGGKPSVPTSVLPAPIAPTADVVEHPRMNIRRLLEQSAA